MHLLESSDQVSRNAGTSIRSGAGTERGTKGVAKSIAPSVPEHKIKFDEFHNQVSTSLCPYTAHTNSTMYSSE